MGESADESMRESRRQYPKDKFGDAITIDTPIGAIKARYEALPLDNLVMRGGTRILKCLGLQYANIPYRWAAPRRKDSYSEIIDCTRFGPGCPQGHHPLFDVDGIPMFGRLGPDSLPVRAETEDEFTCLNLNIYTPVEVTGGENVEITGGVKMMKGLAVLVWVHGGSYQVGSGGVGAYGMCPFVTKYGTHIVARSISLGLPVIVVTFNYRVGVLGFIHSRELAQEAATQSDVPPHFRSTANLGLLDCFMAFDWIKNNIHHFGGDPKNISAMGESAGAAWIINYLAVIPSLHVKLKRVILSSSTCLSIQLLRAAEAQSWYHRLCESLHIPTISPNKIHDLRKVKVEELIAISHSGLSSYRPIWDDVTITFDPREVLYKPELWDDSLESIIFGVCKNEPWLRQASVINKSLNLRKTINSRIPPIGELRAKALQLYGQTSEFHWFDNHDQNIPWPLKSEMAFEGHARYYSPAIQVSESFLSSKPSSGTKRTMYRYLFNWATSHWPTEWPITHASDILPMFLHDSLSPKELDIAYTMTDQLISFAAERTDKLTWREYTFDDRALNELNSRGSWNILNEVDNIFDLKSEYMSFWRQVVHAVLDTSREGWVDMAR